ncbi:MAG: hypothetical protein WAZ14_00505 [Patescibacteria group bacterium]
MSLPQLLKIPSVQAFLMSGDIFDALEDICKKFNLPPERSEEFLDLCDAVMNGDLPIDHMPRLIEEAFAVQPDVANKIALEVIGYRLLPLANIIPGVEEALVTFGGKVSDFPNIRVATDDTVERLKIDEVVTALGLDLSDVLLKRLAFLLKQYSDGEKTLDSLKVYFTRSLNIGGLGLKQDVAESLYAALAAELTDLATVHGAKVATVPEPVVAKAEGEKPVVVKPVVEMAKQELVVATSHEVAAEVPVINTKRVPPPLPKRPINVLAPMVPPVTGAAVAPPVKPVVATAPVTPSKKSELDMDHAELKVSAKRAASAKKLTASSEDSFAAALVLATEQAADVLKKAKISEKVFADLASKAIRGLRDIYQTRDIAERDWGLKGGDLAALMAAITAGVDVYQNSPVVVSETKATKKGGSNSDQEGQALDARFDKLTTSEADLQVKPTHTELTVGSTNLMSGSGQKKMVDVVSSARLAGPIEQLGRLTPAEFRRLSSNAGEAGQKIEDLLSALEATSYEERLKGVLAWRNSPMNQLYLQITAEALSQGLTLPEESSRRRAAGQDSLSPAEIKALALLNAKIRF